jgi:hypothetical protein
MNKGILKKYRLANDAIRISAFGYDVDIPKHVGISLSEPFTYAKPNEVRLIINHLSRRSDQATVNQARPLIHACRTIRNQQMSHDFPTLVRVMKSNDRSPSLQMA